MIAKSIYVLCALASAACAVLLFRMCWRHRGRTTRLALYSSVSLAWFAISNALVFADLVVLRTIDLAVARAATACVASALLLLGLIWETE